MAGATVDETIPGLVQVTQDSSFTRAVAYPHGHIMIGERGMGSHFAEHDAQHTDDRTIETYYSKERLVENLTWTSAKEKWQPIVRHEIKLGTINEHATIGRMVPTNGETDINKGMEEIDWRALHIRVRLLTAVTQQGMLVVWVRPIWRRSLLPIYKFMMPQFKGEMAYDVLGPQVFQLTSMTIEAGVTTTGEDSTKEFGISIYNDSGFSGSNVLTENYPIGEWGITVVDPLTMLPGTVDTATIQVFYSWEKAKPQRPNFGGAPMP